MNLSIQEAGITDFEYIVDYLSNATADYLQQMGADKKLLPAKRDWVASIQSDWEKPLAEKQMYYMIWYAGGRAIGHSNINRIIYGEHANMHLHIWFPEFRKHGYGVNLLRQTIPKYFEHFKLKKLICEPYAHNPAPRKTLALLGFKFDKTYETIPGTICNRQEVSRFVLREGELLLSSDHV